MPSSSDELRSKWGGEDGVGPDKAEGYLKSRGFVLTRDWHWFAPKGFQTNSDDWSAMQFLFEEWDYGWLRNWDEIEQKILPNAEKIQ